MKVHLLPLKFRLLPASAAALAALLLVLEVALRGGAFHTTFLHIEGELVKALAMLGAAVAAFTFGRGDYMRRAWLFIGGCMALLLVRDIIGFFVQPGPTWEVIAGGFAFLANLSQVVGTVMLARAWWISGLTLPGSRLTQFVTVVGVALLAFGAGGPPVVSHIADVAGGDLKSIRYLASSLGDLTTFLLLAPVLLTAVALRGGSIGWPWALLTVSSLAWIGFDTFLVLAPLFDVGPATIRTGSELFRALGCLLGGAAGLAQRWVIVDMRAA